ncbi:PREDICTED: uncharacterized protein LOC106811190 [Priapulus caudatus]|uniref:Uncharacterized protein LOC106811190 n=1 Tax=Priapulus caudatus TaxID=37621 RepID=A0ABM1EDF1_PRICU|nr:PREDICTED: uncharacterized protein LOC106811190 [Priapulus caudatus]XP_014670220.1 PREDICTED: uncharacterized protein LOC106811190 [Priapulus caudatus]XP_014670221.1 PREDICTED: uncharacterized protein LOC106811190 [Priapulus caudatus]XP_014670222.1 PREDICTED: uncharacterized protein LOC106811190 [Priapulus caudatus]
MVGPCAEQECQDNRCHVTRGDWGMNWCTGAWNMVVRYRGNWKLLFLVIIVFAVLVTVGCLYLLTPLPPPATTDEEWKQGERDSEESYSIWPPYSNRALNPPEWYYSSCFGVRDFKAFQLMDLTNRVTAWRNSSKRECRDWLRRFDTIFGVTTTTGNLYMSQSFRDKMLVQLGRRELVKEMAAQRIVEVRNKLTGEQTLFNPLRGRRTTGRRSLDAVARVDELARRTQGTCDFCSYMTMTAADTFGRVESPFSFSAANAFKLDVWHSLFLTRSHHPLDVSEQMLRDLFENTASTWFAKVHSLAPEYRYPHMTWDNLPEAGASQVHPHVHGMITRERYYNRMEHVRRAAEVYHRRHPGRNYFSDLTEIHQALGLAVSYGAATAFAHLTPTKDNEVVIISRAADGDFYSMLHYVIRALVDDMDRLAYSIGIVLPPLGNTDGRGYMPAFARVVSRSEGGNVSDISSIELFNVNNVNVDPNEVFRRVRNSVRVRGVPH